MSEFTASNGKGFSRSYDGHVRYDGEGDMQGRRMMLTSTTEQGLTEFFQHERDEELGRWRTPDVPDHVVYPVEEPHQSAHSRMVNVLNERTGRLIERSETHAKTISEALDKHPGATQAARAWFEAHPKPEPKPWLEAKPGEVWEITTTDWPNMPTRYAAIKSVTVVDERTMLYPMNSLMKPKLGLKAPIIIAGRRLFPEADDA